MAGEDYLEIPALGRFAQLGYLYDARTESFHESIFNSKLDDDADYIITAQTPSTFQEINYTNSVSDKFNLFNIKAEVSMSILFGLFTVSGSAAFLTEDKKSARQTEGAMILKTRTTDEKLEIYFPSLRPKYNLDLLSQSGISASATHVVTGVKWGANVAISFAEKFQESHDKAEASGDLAIAFDKLKAIFSMSGSASVGMKGHDDTTNSGFQFKVYGDIPLPQSVPETFGEIKAFLKTIPESIQNSNQGKGVRLEYSLTPIVRFLEYLTPDIAQNNYFTKLDESFSQEFLRIFDEISAVEQRLNDLNSDLTAYKICTFDKSWTDFSDLKGEFRSAKDRLKTDMKNTLVEVRSGQRSLADLAAVLQGYMAGQYSVRNIEGKLRAFDEALKKIELYKTFKNSYRNPSIDYIGQQGGQGGSLELKLLEKDLIGRVIYIWYIKTEFCKNDPLTWESTAFTFLSHLHQPFHRLIIVDCDFGIPESKNICRTVIKQVINGKVTIEDVHAEFERGNSKLKQKPMEVKAIGRIAQLGDLYDARNDTFLDHSILLPGYPASIIIPAKNDATDIDLIPRETFEYKCEALGVDSELQFSIMAGLVPSRRSGQYLKVNVANSNCVRSILCSQFSDEEGLKINSPEFSLFLDVDNLMKYSGSGAGSGSGACAATHFVSKIQFGFNSIFSLENSTCDGTGFPYDSKNIGFNLEKEARKFKQILARSFTMENSDFVNGTQKPAEAKSDVPIGLLKAEDLRELDPSIKIRVFSDILGAGQSAETIEAGHSNILQYFNRKFFPHLGKHHKGIPISYVLHPIENLQKSHGVLRPGNFSFRTITSLGVDPTGFIALYEKINKANCKIQTLFRELREYPTARCPTDQEISDLEKIQTNFKVTWDTFSSDLKELILKFKAGQQSNQVAGDAFESFLSKYEKLGQFGFGKDGRYLPLDKVALLETKLELCKNLKLHTSAEYIGRESHSSLDHAFSAMATTSTGQRSSGTYLLYFKPQWIKEKASLWLSCSQRFFECLKGNSRFIVDCDFNHFHTKNVTEPTIYEYKDGKLIELVGGLKAVGTSPSLTELYDNLVKRIETLEVILRKQ